MPHSFAKTARRDQKRGLGALADGCALVLGDGGSLSA
jgi:hypothetical protein